MPVTPTYPGVYLQEVSSGARPITGVATAIAAFVDWFPRGPVNEAVFCSSFADFERAFGGIHPWSEASYAIDQFFRNGGQTAYVVRVVTSAARPATTVIQRGTGGATEVLTLTAISAGAWGNNLRARIDPGVNDTHYDLTLYTYDLDGARQQVLREEVLRNVSSTATDPRFVGRVVRDESTLARAAVTAATPNQPTVNGTLGHPMPEPTPPMFPAITPPTKRSVTVSLGTGNGGVTALAPDVDLGNDQLGTPEEVANRLQDKIRQIDPTKPEFAGATVHVIPAELGGGATGIRFHINAGVGADPTARFELTDTAAGPPVATALGMAGATPPVSNVATYQFAATAPARAQAISALGADGDQPRRNELIGSEAPVPPTGMYALNGADLFTLLCLPRVSKDDVTNARHGALFPGNEVNDTLSLATDYCVRRRAMLLVDPPVTVRTIPQAKQFLLTNASLRHPNVAWHWPRIQINDPLDEFRPRSIGNSGTIAGLCARTDAARGVWKAPAGTEATLRGLSRLDYTMTDAENGQLNPLGLNCLRTFDLYGHVNWGGRTSVGQDANPNDWRYLSVRRLALFIEETLFRSTTWVIFEPNDDPLWGQIRLAVGSFMNDLFKKGAFQGRTKQEAYFVRCDATTTTPLDQARGIVNLIVGFAPLKPAEFLIITITQMPPQLEV